MAAASQKFAAETYRDAAKERVVAANDLYQSGKFVEANYLAGLAVECILRAFRVMVDRQFDAKHNMEKLYDLARFDDVVPPDLKERMAAWLGEVVILWNNDHRYLSEKALRKRWTSRKLYSGVKGDFVKERTRKLVEAATSIISFGVARWQTSIKS